MIIQIPSIYNISAITNSIHGSNRLIHEGIFRVFPVIGCLHLQFRLEQWKIQPQVIRRSLLPLQIWIWITFYRGNVFGKMVIQCAFLDNHYRGLVCRHITLVAERSFQRKEIKPVVLHPRMFGKIPIGRSRPDRQKFVVTLVSELIRTIDSGIRVNRKIIKVAIWHG